MFKTELERKKLEAKLDDLYENLLFTPCQTRDELKQWIITFLGIDLPDQTLSEDSNSNPIDFIWAVYQCALTGKGNNSFVVAASRNSCKCLAEGTVVATPSGPRCIEDIEVGDTVYDENSNPITVTHVHDQGIQNCVELVCNKTGQTLAVCTVEHKWMLKDQTVRKVKDFPQNTELLIRHPHQTFGPINDSDGYIWGCLCESHSRMTLDDLINYDREYLCDFLAGLFDTYGIDDRGIFKFSSYSLRITSIARNLLLYLYQVQIPVLSNYTLNRSVHDLELNLKVESHERAYKDIYRRRCNPKFTNTTPSEESAVKVSLRIVGEKHCYDLTVDSPNSLYCLQNGLVTHNTLAAAIIEFMLMLHFGRDIIHLAAILDQSEAAIKYLNRFLRIPAVKKYSKTDNKRLKAIANLPLSEYRPTNGSELRVLVASKESSNAQRASCLPGNAEILIKNGESISWCTAEEVFSLIQKDTEISCLSVNPESRLTEWANIVAAMKQEKEERVTVDGQGFSFTVTPDHLVATPSKSGIIYKKAADLNVGEFILTTPERPILHQKQRYPDFEEDGFSFQDLMDGHMLGDGGVYRRPKNNARFQMSKTTAAESYLTWLSDRMKDVLPIKMFDSKSGYTGQRLLRVASGCSASLNATRGRWYPGQSRFKRLPDDLELTFQKLAIWICDDGISGLRRICCASYSQEETEILCKKINNLVGFDCASLSFTKKGKTRYPDIALSWPQDKREVFYHLISYIHPYYRYKLRNTTTTCIGCGTDFHRHSAEAKCNSCRFSDRKTQQRKVTRKSFLIEKASPFVYDFEVADNHNFVAYRCNSVLLHNCLIYDEVDLLDKSILSESAMIGDPDRNGKPPIFVYLSSRKSASGPIQEKIDQSADEKNGIELHKWSGIDLMKKCETSVHKPLLPKVAIYINKETLEQRTEDEYNAVLEEFKPQYERIEAFAGCVECPAFLVCRAKAPNQESESSILRDIPFIRTIVRETGDIEQIKAQILNQKPESTGTVFNKFSRSLHVRSLEDCYYFAYGVKPVKPLEKTAFIHELRLNGWKLICGVDFGYIDPAAAVLIAYHSKFDKLIVLHTEMCPGYSNQDWLVYVKDTIFDVYGFDLLCPDTADKSSPAVAGRLGMPARNKKPFKIDSGVSWLRARLWSVDRRLASLVVLNDPRNEPLMKSFEQWQYKKGPMGFMYGVFEEDTFATHCFSPDTLVETASGFKRIDEISVGELVLTKEKVYRPVTKVFKRKYEGEMVKISAYGKEPLLCTPNHNIWTGRWERSNEGQKTGQLAHKGNQYTEAGDLSPTIKNAKARATVIYRVPEFDDTKITLNLQEFALPGRYMIEKDRFTTNTGYQGKKTSYPNTIEVDYRLCFIFGYFAAEGSCSKKAGIVDFASHKRESKFRQFCSSYFNTLDLRSVERKTSDKGVRLCLYSSIFTRVFDSLCYNTERDKVLPHFFRGLGRKEAVYLLAGLFFGDGCFSDNIRINLTSKQLILEALHLLTKLGISALFRKIHKAGRFPCDQGSQVKDQYGISLNRTESQKFLQIIGEYEDLSLMLKGKTVRIDTPKTNSCKSRHVDGETHYQLRSIDKVSGWSGYVYNLEVDEHHSYIANGICVKNCLDSLRYSIDPFVVSSTTKYSMDTTGVTRRLPTELEAKIVVTSAEISLSSPESMMSTIREQYKDLYHIDLESRNAQEDNKQSDTEVKNRGSFLFSF